MCLKTLFVLLCLLGVLRVDLAFAETCGETEVKKLEELSDYVCSKRDALNNMAKEKGTSDVRELSLKLLADNLHSVYLVTARMQNLISVSCNVLMCSDLDVEMLTNKFESENMGFGGLRFKMRELAGRYNKSGMVDLVELCDDMEQRIKTVSMLSWIFYGRLHEMRGEKNPPSP